MSGLIVHAMLGASVAVLVALVSRSSVLFLAGLVPLFPTFAIYAHLEVHRVDGDIAVRTVAIFGLLCLLPYASYLSVVALLAGRTTLAAAVAGGLSAWLVVAMVVITGWRVYFAS